MSFAHLHVHTQGSLLDGMNKPKEIAKQAANLGMPALAVTDHGTMYSAVSMYEACTEAGVKPIIGCEVYCAPGSRFERKEVDGERYYHTLLLAKNEIGYKNLVKLVSRGYTEGFYYKPRVDRELLDEFREGIVATSSCLGGEVCQNILRENVAGARAATDCFRDIFGDDFYLEVQDHGLPEQAATNEQIIRIARETGIPLVATNDVHYLRQEDADPHEVLLCIQTGKTMRDPKRLRYGPPSFYLKSPEEMLQRFSHVPEALENTLRIADLCNYQFEFGKHHMPHFEVPAGYTADTWLEKLCRDEIPNTYKAHTEVIEARLKYELGVISSKGFSSYFLIVHDFTEFARSAGIMAQARGSAAGSIVSYLLGLTSIDPLRYNLMFERFLNPERKSMPDIDLDMEDVRREEVIQYCKEKYGEDHVAQIITFGTMGAKAAVKDAGRALDYPLAQVERFTKLISHKVGTTLAGSLESDQELRRMYEQDPGMKRLVDTAQQVEGLYRHASIHAAGVVITTEPVIEYAPVQLMKDGRTCIQYGMEDAEKIGLVKMDFLGLRNLTVAAKTLKLIKELRGVEINLNEIPHNDDAAFRLLQQGRSIGVFQFESSGMQRLLRSLRPDRLEDLIALVALYRPGPLQSGMADSYVNRKHGREEVTYIHPLLEPILSNTYGLILYQEQIMRITEAMAGFGPGQSEAAMKGMGKKKIEVIEKLKVDFLAGCEANKIDLNIAVQLYEVMVNFASYSFNMAHSGAYGYFAYQTAWLKSNYPYEFMTANMSSISGRKDRLAIYINDAVQMGMTILPPDVNHSLRDFSIRQTETGNAIQMGLDAIKGLRDTTVDEVLRYRGGGFASFEDFIDQLFGRVRVAATKGDVEKLIRAGALDCLGERGHMLVSLDGIVERARKGGKHGDRDYLTPPVYPIPEITLPERLAMEREFLGVFVSGHPLADCEDQLRARVDATAFDLGEHRDGDQVTVGGVIHQVTRRKTKTGDAMANVVLEDLTGHVNLVLFPRVYTKFSSLLNKADVLVIRGRISHKDRGGEDEETATQTEITVEDIVRLEERTVEHQPEVHFSCSEEARQMVTHDFLDYPGTVRTVYHSSTGEIDGPSVALCPQVIKNVTHRLRRVGGLVWVQ